MDGRRLRRSFCFADVFRVDALPPPLTLEPLQLQQWYGTFGTVSLNEPEAKIPGVDLLQTDGQYVDMLVHPWCKWMPLYCLKVGDIVRAIPFLLFILTSALLLIMPRL